MRPLLRAWVRVMADGPSPWRRIASLPLVFVTLAAGWPLFQWLAEDGPPQLGDFAISAAGSAVLLALWLAVRESDRLAQRSRDRSHSRQRSPTAAAPTTASPTTSTTCQSSPSSELGVATNATSSDAIRWTGSAPAAHDDG